MDASNEDAYYIKACSFIHLNKDYEAAYATLKMMMIQTDYPRDDSFRLFGFIAVHLQPKLIVEAIDSFNVLIQRNPKNFSALLHRACCNNCLQEWDAVLKDLTFILIFQPESVHAHMLRWVGIVFYDNCIWIVVLIVIVNIVILFLIVFRARAYSCLRRWHDAKLDYQYILNNAHPKYHPAAQKGMEDLLHSEHIMPMINADILNNV